MVGRRVGSAGAIALLLAATAHGAAAAPRPALHGIALGMRAPQIPGASHLACSTTPAGDLTCDDPADGSTFDVGMSGGTPSIALRVVRTFCSAAPAASVLRGFARSLGVDARAAEPDPNGFFFDIGTDDEGVLDVSLGRCPDGRERIQESIRDDELIVFSLKQARRRRKAAGR